MMDPISSNPHDFYSKNKEQLFDLFKTNINGLSASEAEERLKKYGQNKLEVKKAVSPLTIFINQFKNALIIILLVATALILFVYFFGEREQADLIEAGLIFGIVMLIALLGFVQEYKAEKAVEALKKLLAFKAAVRRDGRDHEIKVEELVPGDIISLSEGARVPADIRLIEVYELKANEASLTGESVPVSKRTDVISAAKAISDQNNMVFSGTTITGGRALGIVVTTGNSTEIGKIAKSVAEIKEEDTPLQVKLSVISKKIGYIVLVISATVFLFVVFFAEEFTHLSLLARILHSFIASIALAVAAIPEGLPAVVTISLALGTQRMLAKKALVKKLSSVETLGSTDIICADKTGTLTRGEMTVREIYVKGKVISVTGSGYEKTGDFVLNGSKVDAGSMEEILTCGLICNDASFNSGDQVIGDPTEAALIVSAAKAGIDTSIKRIHEIPFSSERKMMSVVVEKEGKYIVYTKGAPELVLKHCAVANEDANEALKKTEEMSMRALRTLGFATKQISAEEFKNSEGKSEILEKDLQFLGVQGMDDPPRPEVKELISLCKSSGVRIIMITGDHEQTAKAIAHEIGIEGDVVNGEKLSSLSETDLISTVNQINIYARVNPEDKFKIVSALKSEKHIVAMTGDGVNDAPALKRADIGIAMGITGTDVAKEASDVVLMDDQFKTVIASVEEGRGIYQNIRKFVYYLLSCNMAEVLIVVAALFLLHELPFTATMLLWINVVTDGLPALAIALDPPSPNIMKDPPAKFQSAIIEKRGWISMGVFAVGTSIAVLYIFIVNLPEGQKEAASAAFMALVVFELINVFLVRASYGTKLFSNHWLFGAIIGTLILQLVITFVSPVAALFGIVAIDVFDFVLIGVFSIVLWLILFAWGKFYPINR